VRVSLPAGPWSYTDDSPENTNLPSEVAAAAKDLAAVVVGGLPRTQSMQSASEPSLYGDISMLS
jgi:hypothetical protein